MLIDFSVQNFSSLNKKQELNMLASSPKSECELENVHEVGKFGITNVLKSAAIFGANGSGKSNFVRALGIMKHLVLDSFDSSGESAIQSIVPFLLKEVYYDEPTEFEVTFLAEGVLFRYGLAIVDDKIEEEWLYWTPTVRETQLFHRIKQEVSYNQRSFSEAKLFIKSDGDIQVVDKTKPSVPFISVLAQFDGEKSNIVHRWFSKVNLISGLQEKGFKNFTINLFQGNQEFQDWAIKILKSIQVYDVKIVEFEKEVPKANNVKAFENDEELLDAFTKIEGFLERNRQKEKRIELVKKGEGGELYSMPVFLESEGTQKLIYLLGPLFDVIKGNEILVVDEFDNKFHTLLSKFIISVFHHNNHGESQLLVTCHDTNLMTNELFRRDQIWFVEKNKSHESELFSLVEYREHYVRKGSSYSKDYLLGKYGAIPLFSDIQDMELAING